MDGLSPTRGTSQSLLDKTYSWERPDFLLYETNRTPPDSALSWSETPESAVTDRVRSLSPLIDRTFSYDEEMRHWFEEKLPEYD